MKRFMQYLIEATMTTSDALKVLKLTPHFTPDQLKDAYKKAAIANHPDKGGSVAKMQQINVARDILANSGHDSHEEPRKDDGYGTPYPQEPDIRYMMVYQMFRSDLNADIRARVGDGQIRVPLMSKGTQYQRNGNPVVLVIQRQKTMLGVEYAVQGIYESRGGVLKAIIKFNNMNEDMAFWESKKSVMWFIKNVQTLRSMSLDLAQIAGKLTELLKAYSKNPGAVDSNVN
jgi:hypothetical protein